MFKKLEKQIEEARLNQESEKLKVLSFLKATILTEGGLGKVAKDKVSTSNAVVDSATRKLFNKNVEMMTKGIESKKGEFTSISDEDKVRLFPTLELQNEIYREFLLPQLSKEEMLVVIAETPVKNANQYFGIFKKIAQEKEVNVDNELLKQLISEIK